MIVALVLLSAFLHAAWNALLRLEPDKDRGLVGAVAVATLVATIVAAFRAAYGGPPFPGAGAVGWALVAGVTEWIYFGSLARALERGPLGPIYTVSRGGAILVVWPVSMAAFGETATLAAAIGSAIVFGGLALSGAGAGDPRTAKPGALAWAIACAISIAGYHLAYKAALGAGGSPSAVFALALALSTALNLASLGRAGRHAMRVLVRTRLPRVLLMGVVCGSSFLILLEALAAGGPGFVLTLRNTSVLFATGLAAAIGERPRRPQLAGAILVAAGAILMAWPAA